MPIIKNWFIKERDGYLVISGNVFEHPTLSIDGIIIKTSIILSAEITDYGLEIMTYKNKYFLPKDCVSMKYDETYLERFADVYFGYKAGAFMSAFNDWLEESRLKAEQDADILENGMLYLEMSPTIYNKNFVRGLYRNEESEIIEDYMIEYPSLEQDSVILGVSGVRWFPGNNAVTFYKDAFSHKASPDRILGYIRNVGSRPLEVTFSWGNSIIIQPGELYRVCRDCEVSITESIRKLYRFNFGKLLNEEEAAEQCGISKKELYPEFERQKQEDYMSYTDRRMNNIRVFEDTRAFYDENCELKTAMKKSRNNTVCYQPDEYPEIENAEEKACKISVTEERTFECAMRLNSESPDSRIAVLNFASASNPGGGVKNGSSAQEEALCRCSTLYPCLDSRPMWEQFYDINRGAGNVLHTDACIYSPDIVICKTDSDNPERLPQDKWVYVDVITCAAPNLREKPSNAYNLEMGAATEITAEELYSIHLSRARHILHIAAANGIDKLVLGAFGCGAFRNDPKAVANAYKDALKEMGKYFDEVVFAVYCGSQDNGNYRVFKDILA